MTRSTTAHLFSSLNGVAESPDAFQFDAFGEEEGKNMGSALAGVTDVVMGRVLWEEWSSYWPSADDQDPFAGFINPVRKHVVSSTLSEDPGWNSVLVDSDPVEYVRALRDRDDDGGIIVAGGIETVRSLFLGGVVDALTLTVHPTITGSGRRLFDEDTSLTRLQLLDGTTTSSGNAVLTYGLRG